MIGPDGVAALGRALAVNNTLCEIQLKDNSTQPQGAKWLLACP
jgi:hypothetical protein